MPRRARIVFENVPHHVTQRGIDRSPVFFARNDGAAYLTLLRDYSERHQLEIVAYCLMPNHVHLVVVPPTADGLHRVLKPVHGLYARRINRIRDRVGHLWQNRFFSSPLDPSYFVNAVRYVELNPVKARLVGRAEDYEWSSAATHCGGRSDPLVGRKPRSNLFQGIQNWSEWLSRGLNDESAATLRRNVRQNLPCGSDAFVKSLEDRSGERLRPRERGRPRRQDDSKETGRPFLEKVNVPVSENGTFTLKKR